MAILPMCVLQQVSNLNSSEDAYTGYFTMHLQEMLHSRPPWQHHSISMRRNMEGTSPGAGQAPAVSPQCPSSPQGATPPPTAGQVSRWDTCPVAESVSHFLLVLLHGSVSAGSPASLDTDLTPSTVVRTLNLLCS